MKAIRWSPHAKLKLEKREIDKGEAELTVRNPDSITAATSPRKFFQRRYVDELLQAEMLLRVVVEETDSELVVVTLYKTSQFRKYERGQRV